MGLNVDQRLHRSLQACCIVVLATLGACNVQNHLLYAPPASSRTSVNPEQMIPWPSVTNFRGYISRNSGDRGTVVVFHGNGTNATDNGAYITALSPLGYRVLLHEYPAYGGRGGDLGEASFVADARYAIRLLAAQVQGPIYLLGNSLGAGVAAAVAADDFGVANRMQGVILIVPWDTLASLTRSKLANLPVDWLLTDRYDSIVNLSRFAGRIAVIGAQNDQEIPVIHAQTLFQRLPGNKRWWLIPERGHNDWQSAVNQEWWKEVMSYVEGKPLD